MAPITKYCSAHPLGTGGACCMCGRRGQGQGGGHRGRGQSQPQKPRHGILRWCGPRPTHHPRSQAPSPWPVRRLRSRRACLEISFCRLSGARYISSSIRVSMSVWCRRKRVAARYTSLAGWNRASQGGRLGVLRRGLRRSWPCGCGRRPMITVVPSGCAGSGGQPLSILPSSSCRNAA